MPVVLLQLPDLTTRKNERPDTCPHCDSVLLQRWGRVTKPIKDTGDHTRVIYRYRCLECNRTFRHYPRGVDRSTRSLRMKHFATLIWTLGLSYRDVAYIFEEFDVNLSRSSLWRWKKDVEERLKNPDLANLAKKYVIETDFSRKNLSLYGVIVAIDLGENRVGVLGALDEDNPERVKEWLEMLAAGSSIQVNIMNTGLLDYLDNIKLGEPANIPLEEFTKE